MMPVTVSRPRFSSASALASSRPHAMVLPASATLMSVRVMLSLSLVMVPSAVLAASMKESDAVALAELGDDGTRRVGDGQHAGGVHRAARALRRRQGPPLRGAAADRALGGRDGEHVNLRCGAVPI